jgi:hypothetical protein
MTIDGLSGNLWPIHLKPFQDELLSSWLVRLAHGHGLKLQTFCALVFGRDKSMWNRDIDKLAPVWLIAKLVECTGAPLQAVVDTTLKSYEGVLYEHHQPNGNTKWILPLGVYHRTHHDFGLQFCQQCLAEDAEPYYRKQWRLAFYTECEKHQVLMHDRCPNCSASVNFHRAEMGARSLIRGSTVLCHSCGFDLRCSSSFRTPCQDWRTFTTCRSLLLSHQMGWSFIENTEFPYAQNLFEVLRHLCRLMGSNRRASRLLPYVADQLGLDVSAIKNYGNSNFEQRSVAERHLLFCCSVWLLLDWPNRFVSACEELRLSSAYLLVDFKEPPYWFASAINDELYQGQYSPTEQEFIEAGKWLFGKGRKVSITAISRLLGCATLKNRSKRFSLYTKSSNLNFN